MKVPDLQPPPPVLRSVGWTIESLHQSNLQQTSSTLPPFNHCCSQWMLQQSSRDSNSTLSPNYIVGSCSSSKNRTRWWRRWVICFLRGLIVSAQLCELLKYHNGLSSAHLQRLIVNSAETNSSQCCTLTYSICYPIRWEDIPDKAWTCMLT